MKRYSQMKKSEKIEQEAMMVPSYNQVQIEQFTYTRKGLRESADINHYKGKRTCIMGYSSIWS